MIWSLHPSCLQRNFHFPILRGFLLIVGRNHLQFLLIPVLGRIPYRQTSSILVDYIPIFCGQRSPVLLIKSSILLADSFDVCGWMQLRGRLDTPKSSEYNPINSSVHFWHGLWASESSPQAKKTTNRGLSENGEYSPTDHSNFNGEYENGPLEFRVKTPKFSVQSFFGGRCLKPTLHHSANTRNKTHGEKIDLKESSKSPYFSISLLIFDPPKRLGLRTFPLPPKRPSSESGACAVRSPLMSRSGRRSCRSYPSSGSGQLNPRPSNLAMGNPL